MYYTCLNCDYEILEEVVEIGNIIICPKCHSQFIIQSLNLINEDITYLEEI